MVVFGSVRSVRFNFPLKVRKVKQCVGLTPHTFLYDVEGKHLDVLRDSLHSSSPASRSAFLRNARRNFARYLPMCAFFCLLFIPLSPLLLLLAKSFDSNSVTDAIDNSQ